MRCWGTSDNIRLRLDFAPPGIPYSFYGQERDFACSAANRGHGRSNHVLYANGVRVLPTTDAARASTSPLPCATHDARDWPVCCDVHVLRLPHEVHAPRERSGADTGPVLLPQDAVRRRKPEPLRELVKQANFSHCPLTDLRWFQHCTSMLGIYYGFARSFAVPAALLFTIS
jgi:hypothetical protein